MLDERGNPTASAEEPLGVGVRILYGCGRARLGPASSLLFVCGRSRTASGSGRADEVAARGVRVRHNLERRSIPPWARLGDGVARSLVGAVGGYGGDFGSILASLRVANTSDVIVSTVDRVGIPLILLANLGIVRRPIVYIAIGLPERLAQLRGTAARRLYRRALRGTRVILSYADSEVAWLRDWLGPGGPPVVFIPFGVDVHAFRAGHNAGGGVDVVSVGADPQRDFKLLVAVAERQPELSFHVVATEEWGRVLGKPPANVSFESGLSLEQVRDRLAAARGDDRAAPGDGPGEARRGLAH